jgi:hypothetical protein
MYFAFFEGLFADGRQLAVRPALAPVDRGQRWVCAR